VYALLRKRFLIIIDAWFHLPNIVLPSGSFYSIPGILALLRQPETPPDKVDCD
jgi:hypothetical protein